MPVGAWPLQAPSAVARNPTLLASMTMLPVMGEQATALVGPPGGADATLPVVPRVPPALLKACWDDGLAVGSGAALLVQALTPPPRPRVGHVLAAVQLGLLRSWVRHRATSGE